MRISILWKLMVPMVLVVSVLASALLWAQLRLLDQSFRRRVQGRLSVASEILKMEQRDLEERMLFAADLLSYRTSTARTLTTHDPGAFAGAMARVAASTRTPPVSLFDSRGAFFAASWPTPPGPPPPYVTALVDRGLAGTPVVGAAPSWRWPGHVSVVATAPVQAGARIIGVAVAETLVGDEFVDEIKRLTNLEATVFLGDRRVATTIRAKDGTRVLNIPARSPAVRRVLADGNAISEDAIIGGQRIIGRYVPLRSATGSIIGIFAVGAPADRFFGDRDSLIRSAIGTSALALVLACAVAITLGYRILTPIRRLRASAEAIRHGAPEKADFTIATHDEIQDLSTTMAEMVSALQARERDLTTANVALEEASRHKSEFLSRMSHELRTPLNAILGFGQLLEMDHLPGEQQESVRQILKGGRHLLGLIDEVLDMASIEAGRLTISRAPVRMSDALQDAVDLVGPMAAAQNIGLRSVQHGPCQRHVLADRQRLKQVFLNLLSNAVKYNRPGGTATVSCEETADRRLRVNVVDTGRGIPPEKLERLFTPFDRLGAEQTGVEGSGLGLSLSKRLIEAMGGTLEVASTPGRGSTFRVELPIVQTPVDGLETSGEPARAPARPASSQDAQTILYIEDDLSNFTLIQRLLAHRPELTLLPAMQGRVGLHLAREHRPNLILLDLQLPDQPGADVLRRLREMPETREIPVAVISADATPGQIERLRAAGADHYLTKPLNVHTFLSVLDDALAKRGSHLAGRHA